MAFDCSPGSRTPFLFASMVSNTAASAASDAATKAAATAGAARDKAAAAIVAEKEHFKLKVIDASEPVVDLMVDRVADKILLHYTGEPEMPAFFRRAVNALVGSALPDIRMELKDTIIESVLKEEEEEEEETTPVPWCCSPWRWRAFILYHLVPCDKGFWAKTRDVSSSDDACDSIVDDQGS